MTTANQKVAVITGASRGIGAALVQAYRKHGWAVVANSRSIPASDDAGVVTVAGDIADPAIARNVIETAVRDFGRVDTLVNNAGIFIAKPFTDYTAEDYQVVIGVNLTGFVTATQLAIAQMLRQDTGGHIVQVTTSLVGLHPVGRMGTMSDIVDGVLYLENAPFVTGEILHIDGGQSAGH